MNYSTAIFLVNPAARAVMCTYDLEAEGKSISRTMFKTVDPSIAVDDLVIVPTDTRHGMTVCKVVETDVDVDFESSGQVKWIVGRIDKGPYEQALAAEQAGIAKIKSAEMRAQREALAKKLFADMQDEEVKALPMSTIGGAAQPAEEV
jgi:hypothetical protein